jgi:hypothetical protein
MSPKSIKTLSIYLAGSSIVTVARTAKCLISPTLPPSGVSIGQKYPKWEPWI